MAEMKENALICIKCGASSNPQREGRPIKPRMEKEDDLWFIFFIFGLSVPLIGFIIWLVCRNVRPRRSKGALVGALLPMIASILFIILIAVLFFLGVFDPLIEVLGNPESLQAFIENLLNMFA